MISGTGREGIISLLFSGGLGERECILYCKNKVERPADNLKKGLYLKKKYDEQIDVQIFIRFGWWLGFYV
jgi:hypothetical protein